MPSRICNFSTAAMAVCLFAWPASAQQPVGDRAAELETQLIDLQVQIATLRSLKGPVSTPRITALEGEMRELARTYQKVSGRPASIRPGATSALAPGAAVAQPDQPGVPAGQAANAGDSWFGSTTVTRNDGGPAPFGGGELRRESVFPVIPGGQADAYPQNPYPQNPGSRDGAGATAALNRGGIANRADQAAPRSAPGQPAGGAEEEYKVAYSALLQQDYGAAEAAFSGFVQRHPQSSLAGNAQYWLGETYYVQGDYRRAAKAFLDGFEKYGDGNKGPDSLLKLALSLAKLDQTAPACSSLREVARRYPSAPAGILQRAKSEADRLRCPA